jgi:ABC-type Na+ efflux pump permease subunit
MMTAKKLSSFVGLCFMVCFSFAIFTPDLYAQGDSTGTKNNDKSLATKRGVSQSLNDADAPKRRFNSETGQMEDIPEEELEGPSKLQMGLGLGSIPVAFIVMKYL